MTDSGGRANIARLRIKILQIYCKIFHNMVQIVTDEKYKSCKTGFNVNHVICALHEKPHEECALVAALAARVTCSPAHTTKTQNPVGGKRPCR